MPDKVRELRITIPLQRIPTSGWMYDFAFMEKLREQINNGTDEVFDVSIGDVEEVIKALFSLAAVESAPVPIHELTSRTQLIKMGWAPPNTTQPAPDVEALSAAVHRAYCADYLKRKGAPYWTDGDYDRLDEETKEIGRATVRAVLSALQPTLIRSTPTASPHVAEADFGNIAALQPVQAEPECCVWRPIESAPRDGTNILLCADGKVAEGGWVEDDDGEGHQMFAGWWWTDGSDFDPTHWMRLPRPIRLAPAEQAPEERRVGERRVPLLWPFKECRQPGSDRRKEARP